MHRVNLKLNLIAPGIPHVGISVEDGQNLFVPTGTLTAILESGLNSTFVTWTQISGVPVTVTSAPGAQVLEFTASELGKKRFKACVNVGTSAEECDEADFYHFPRNYLNPSEILNGTIKQSYFPDASSLKLRAHAAIGALTNFNLDADAIKQSLAQVKPSAYDKFTNFYITGMEGSKAKAFTKTRIEIYNIATSTWVLWKEYSKGQDNFTGMNDILNKNIRVVLDINYYGVSDQIILYDGQAINDVTLTSGVREPVVASNRILHGSMSNYIAVLGSMGNIDTNDTVESHEVLHSSLKGFNAVHGSYHIFDDQVFIDQETEKVLQGRLQSYVAVLHTSTGVI